MDRELGWEGASKGNTRGKGDKTAQAVPMMISNLPLALYCPCPLLLIYIYIYSTKQC